jgi:hypothetical protein
MGNQNFDILSPKGTSHTDYGSEWGNETFVNRLFCMAIRVAKVTKIEILESFQTNPEFCLQYMGSIHAPIFFHCVMCDSDHSMNRFQPLFIIRSQLSE